MEGMNGSGTELVASKILDVSLTVPCIKRLVVL